MEAKDIQAWVKGAGLEIDARGQIAKTSSSGVCPASHPAVFCNKPPLQLGFSEANSWAYTHQLMEPFK